MKNSEVAGLLDELGDLVEANGEDRFKVIAYRRAATSVRNLNEDIETCWREGRLEDIKYIGSGIAKKIDEFLGTGNLRLLNELRRKVPRGVPVLIKVQGIGPRTAYKLSHELGICSIEDLKKAIDSGSLDNKFGPTILESFRVGIKKLQSFERRMLLPEAEAIFQMLSSYFSALGFSVDMAGSLRRGKSTIGDLDILATQPGVIEAATGCPGVAQVLEKGPKRASFKLADGVQVDIRLFAEEEYGAAMMYFTGSKDHNIALRNLAIRKGWKLNEYGLFSRDGGRLAGKSEEEIYGRLGLDYIPPELRENGGEIEAAEKGELPNLLKADDIKGDLQMHSTWSDGSVDIEGMAKACKERGYEYMALTDHSVSVRVANGLTEERFRRQWKEIDSLNESLSPFRILKAVEVEIKADGTVDLGRAFLDEFDIVGASLHQNFKQDAGKLTERAVTALKHPSVDFLCHPTNRLIGKREGNPINMKKVIEIARDNGKMLEIDGEPERLDMDELWAKRAIEEGVAVVVDSDAHSIGQLDNLLYGVLTARRGWVEAKNVANTKSIRTLLNAVS